MLSISSATPIYLVSGVTDMRKSYNGLVAIVRNHLGDDPLSGSVYLFCNRRRDRIKLLAWDGSGLWVCAKRLEKGTFAWPETGARTVELTSQELVLLLGGLDLQGVHRRSWYRRAPTRRFRGHEQRRTEPVRPPAGP